MRNFLDQNGKTNSASRAFRAGMSRKSQSVGLRAEAEQASTIIHIAIENGLAEVVGVLSLTRSNDHGDSP